MKVVLAEDSAPTRRLLQATLERCGHEVAAVGDGQAALDAFEHTHPALVVLDWQMPVMDGLEACRRLRTMPNGDHAFVLMVTSRDADGDLAIALDAGVDDYVMKPFTAEQLRARVAIAERRLEHAAAHRKAEEALAHAQWLAGIGEATVAMQHEVNNPLTALMAHVGLAATEECTPAMREHLDVITQQVRRIAAVMRRLSSLGDPRSVEYTSGNRMIDLGEGGGDR
jgi:DNA-binding response OmpR family regulator